METNTAAPTKKRSSFWLFTASIIIIGLTLLPSLYVAFQARGVWQGVTPFYDGGYYYGARLREITDGFPFIGNPYFIEHQAEPSVAFFVADWLAAVPLLMGANFPAAMTFNFIFWSLCLVGGLFCLFRTYTLSREVSLGAAGLGFVVSYTLMLRAVSMQVIMPFFVLFLIALARWTLRPRQGRAQLFLVLAFTATFYIYTYLWQVTVVVMGLALIAYFAARQKKIALALLKIILISGSLALPVFWYMRLQMAHPDYWETIERIGLVTTHLPSARVLWVGLWTLAAACLWIYTWKRLKTMTLQPLIASAALVFSVSAFALLVASGSNVITGKELENAPHIERFLGVWLMSSVVIYTALLIKNRPAGANIQRRQVATVACLYIFLLAGTGYYVQQNFFAVLRQHTAFAKEIKEIQRLGAPLAWLEKHSDSPQVVWADSSFVSDYIPILTKHYVLFNTGGILHLLPSSEAEERYLVQNSFRSVTTSTLVQGGYRDFMGVGPALHVTAVHNRKVRYCELLRLPRFGYNCGIQSDLLSLKGLPYFEATVKRSSIARQNIPEYLTKFKVAYILKANLNETFLPEKLPGVSQIYRDDYFSIYQVASVKSSN